MNTRQRLLSIVRGDDHTVIGRLGRLGLSCLTPGYLTAVQCRNICYDTGWCSTHHLGRPVISIGNLTVGGTGKTPMVIAIAGRLQSHGHRPAILLRGYHATEQSGSDEAGVLKQALGPGVPVEPDPNRIAAAQRVLRNHPDTNVFLLDDGFQHRQVHRDLDIVLIDAVEPFGHRRLLPRGLLREPIRNLRRADAVVITRADQCPPDHLAQLDRQIQRITNHHPTAYTSHRWAGLRGTDDGEYPLTTLAHARVIGVCGIGQPAAFEHTLRKHAGQLIKVRAFPDHHAYRQADIHSLIQHAYDQQADAVVITEKDWVKWKPYMRDVHVSVKVYRTVLEMTFLKGADDLDRLTHRILSHNDDHRHSEGYAPQPRHPTGRG